MILHIFTGREENPLEKELQTSLTVSCHSSEALVGVVYLPALSDAAYFIGTLRGVRGRGVGDYTS